MVSIRSIIQLLAFLVQYGFFVVCIAHAADTSIMTQSVDTFVAFCQQDSNLEVQDLASLCVQYKIAIGNYFPTGRHYIDADADDFFYEHTVQRVLKWEMVPSSTDELVQRLQELPTDGAMANQWQLPAGTGLFICHQIPTREVALYFFIAVMQLVIANPGKVFFYTNNYYVSAFIYSADALLNRFSPVAHCLAQTISAYYPIAYLYDNDKIYSVDIINDTRGCPAYFATSAFVTMMVIGGWFNG